MRGIILFLLLVFIIGCDDGCKVEETRCDGNVAQVCNSSQNWEEMDDCDKVGDGTPFEFVCQFSDEEDQHVCVPNLEEGDGGVDDAG